MNKKIMLLAFSALATAMFALPATASASLEATSLHMSPPPAKMDVSGTHMALRFADGHITTCGGVSGTATPAAGGTTGTIQLTFGPHCAWKNGGTCTSVNPTHPSGSITTPLLTYHLATLKGKSPGILLRPVNGLFMHINCVYLGLPIQTTIEVNGILGTITGPGCGGSASTATLSFKGIEGSTTQQHRELEGTTPGPYGLTKGGQPASFEAHLTLTLTNSTGVPTNSQLLCT